MTRITIWEELEAMADKLAVAGQVSLPDLRTLRAASVQMGNWFEANEELRARLESLEVDNLKYRIALKKVQEVSGMVARYAGLESHEFGDSSFARDFAPFINLMGIHHKDPDYGTPIKPTGHIDTKQAPRQKKKEAAA